MDNNQITLVGTVQTIETNQVTTGQFSEVTVPTSDGPVTLVGEIRKMIRSARSSKAVGVRVEVPGQGSQLITSLDSPSLYNADGSEKAVPTGASLKLEYASEAAGDAEIPVGDEQLAGVEEKDEAETEELTPAQVEVQVAE